jgi:plastocyanin
MNAARITRRLLVPAVAAAAATALVVPSGTAGAPVARPATHTAARAGSVTVANMAFSPAAVTTSLGGSVTWTFKDATAHTSTSDQGFWDSGTRSGGATYSRTFTSAGTYAYHCTIHSVMRGTVKVRLTASGTPGKGYKLTWATTKGAGGITYDVQTRLGSGRWVSLKKATTGTHAKFNPAKAGKYSVRARTAKGGKRSGWSPTVTVTIS